jgi:predicted ester cyclase
MMRGAFPDLRMNVQDMLVEGDKVAVRVLMSGTHQGEFLGMSGTGRRFSATSIDIVRVVDGKAAEHWGVTDTMAMMQQLGALPQGTPAPGSA